jgi:hypothetical protein
MRIRAAGMELSGWEGENSAGDGYRREQEVWQNTVGPGEGGGRCQVTFWPLEVCLFPGELLAFTNQCDSRACRGWRWMGSAPCQGWVGVRV